LYFVVDDPEWALHHCLGSPMARPWRPLTGVGVGVDPSVRPVRPVRPVRAWRPRGSCASGRVLCSSRGRGACRAGVRAGLWMGGGGGPGRVRFVLLRVGSGFAGCCGC
jgi:hypothetical protein